MLDPALPIMNPQTDPLIISIERTQKAIYFMSGINIILLLPFAAISCLYRNVCHTSLDIDIPPYASHSFLPLLLITLLLTIISYESAEYIHINYLRPLRLILILYSLIMILYTVAEFVAGMILADTNRETTWSKLSPVSKRFYDDDLDNLNLDYRVNMILVCLFQLINSLILFACGIAVWVLYSKTPAGYLPRPKHSSVEETAVLEKPVVNDPFAKERIGDSVEERKFVDSAFEDSRFRGSPEPDNREISGYGRHEEDRGIGPRMQDIREDEIPMATRNPFLRRG